MGIPYGSFECGTICVFVFQGRLICQYGNQRVLFIVSIYGWYNWAHPGEQETRLRVKRLNRKETLIAICSMMILLFFIWRLLRDFPESSYPFFDALTTSIFIIAMVLQALKCLESWILWIAGDFIAIPLFASSGLAFTCLQYLAFLIMAISGFFSWKKSLLRND